MTSIYSSSYNNFRLLAIVFTYIVICVEIFLLFLFLDAL